MVVTRFLPLTPSDLEAWTNDPEGWFVKEETEVDHIEFEVRASRCILQRATVDLFL